MNTRVPLRAPDGVDFYFFDIRQPPHHGMGLAQKRGYDSDEDQEPQPRFFSSRIEHQSGLELAAKIRRCKARARAMGAGD